MVIKKRLVSSVLILVLCIFSLKGLGFSEEKKQILITSFEENLEKIVFFHAKGTQDSSFVTDGRFSLKVEFKSDYEWPQFNLYQEKVGFPEDWRYLNTILVDVFNPEGEAVTFGIRIDDKDHLGKNWSQAHFSVPPKTKKTFSFVVGGKSEENKLLEGMRGDFSKLPEGTVKPIWIQLSPEVDISQVRRIMIFLPRPAKDHTLYFDNLRLVHSEMIKLEGMADRFGQYAYSNWEGKVFDENDLAKQKREEEKYLKRLSLPKDRDEYGGWMKGPKLKETGFFRVEKVDNKWWLVTPKGHIFWSVGMDEVFPIYDQWTYIEGREKLFSWLPKEGEDFYSFVEKRNNRKCINFLEINRMRKYGKEYKKEFEKVTMERLKRWGFTTLASWNGDVQGKNMPYIVNLTSRAIPPITSYDGGKEWGKAFPDIFHPDALSLLENSFAHIKKYSSDPYLIGYIVDNELHWHLLNNLVLSANENCHSKRELVRILKERYGTIEDLNRSWGTNLSSWDEVLKNPLSLPTTDAGKRDLSEFLYHYAEKYFSLINQAIKKYDPNHMYMGAQFVPWGRDEVVKAASLYCDIISFNYYWYEEKDEKFPLIEGYIQRCQLDKPIIIGEFHFGSLDTGLFWKGVSPLASNQKERGQYYQRYIRNLLNTSWAVGAGWFIYFDQALTGRFANGENGNTGFVSVTDTPYYDLIRSAREINFKVYEIRTGKTK